MKNHWMSISCAFLFMLLAILPTQVRADMFETFYFQNITANNAADALAGEGQLSVVVTGYESGGNLTSLGFKFLNNVGEQMSITDLFIYDGVLMDLEAPTWSWEDSDDDGTDVLFNAPANPGHLPGWGTAGVLFSADSGDKGLGAVAAGVNTKFEWVEVLVEPLDGVEFEDVISGIRSGAIVLGVHVQGFVGGGSESFITTPLPGAVLLGMLGLGYAGMKLRKHV